MFSMLLHMRYEYVKQSLELCETVNRLYETTRVQLPKIHALIWVSVYLLLVFVVCFFLSVVVLHFIRLQNLSFSKFVLNAVKRYGYNATTNINGTQYDFFAFFLVDFG